MSLLALYQGTTSVVPSPTKMVRALAPATEKCLSICEGVELSVAETFPLKGV
jgi:hypothetical protein